MPATAANLFLLEDLEDSRRTGRLAESDLTALQAVADWIKSYVLKPSKDIGRTGTVCPFLPRSVDQKTLWLAPEHSGNQTAPDVVQLMTEYKRLLLGAQPSEGDDADYNVIAVVFTDLPPDRAKGVFDDVQQQLGVPSYTENGALFGPYYQGNEATALYNASFRPFESPMPFLFVRHGVISDWKFFVDSEEWLTLWARRYGEAAVQTLAAELRRTNWRQIGA